MGYRFWQNMRRSFRTLDICIAISLVAICTFRGNFKGQLLVARTSADTDTSDKDVVGRAQFPPTTRQATTQSAWSPSRLQLRLVANALTTGPSQELADPGNPKLKLRVLDQVVLDASDVQWARAANESIPTPGPGHWTLLLFLTDAGSARLERITSRNIGRQLAIFWDGKLIASPEIRERLSQEIIISAKFTRGQVESIAHVLDQRPPVPLSPQAAVAEAARGQAYEKVIKDTIRLGEDLTRTLQSVTDEKSAHASVKKIRAYARRLQSICHRWDKSNPSPRQVGTIGNKYRDEGDRITKQLNAQLERIEAHQDLWLVLRGPLKPLMNILFPLSPALSGAASQPSHAAPSGT